MKKVLLAIVSLAIVFAVIGCGTANVPGEPDSPSDITDPQPDTTDVPEIVDLPILEEIDNTVTVGTAGAYLSAVKGAGMLLDWANGTGLDAEEVAASAAAWINGLDEEARELFVEKLGKVDEAVQRLTGDEDAASLLEEAGYTSEAYPWSESEVVDAVMSAAGLR